MSGWASCACRQPGDFYFDDHRFGRFDDDVDPAGRSRPAPPRERARVRAARPDIPALVAGLAVLALGGMLLADALAASN